MVYYVETVKEDSIYVLSNGIRPSKRGMEKWRIEISLYKVTLMPLLQICLIVYNKCFFFFFNYKLTNTANKTAIKKKNKTKQKNLPLD